jgi:CubicO group peptidase (beta-lactamase class C family)
MNSKMQKLIIFCISIFLLLGFGISISVSGEVNQEYWPTKEWRNSTPEDQGMISASLENMDKYIKNKCPLVRSILVIRHGYIVFEKYYNGDVSYDNHIYSATKSFVSALIGIALDKGYIKNIDQKIFEFFPEYTSEITDPRLKEITIRDLLTMSAGFATSFRGPPDLKSSFFQPIVTDPGSHSAYNSGETYLLSGIISKTTKMNSLEFGYENLFKPLGIQKPKWGSGPGGYTIGGYGLHLRIRDMAKLGYLYLRNGVWDGKQVVPEKWVKESTCKQAMITMGPKKIPYGYQWWIIASEGHLAFCAIGLGGQYITVIPDLDIVIAVSSDSMSLKPQHQGVVPSFVIPAVLKK